MAHCLLKDQLHWLMVKEMNIKQKNPFRFVDAEDPRTNRSVMAAISRALNLFVEPSRVV